MFNSVNNPFGQKVNMAFSMSQDKEQRHHNDEEEKEHNYLEDDDNDEVKIGGLPILTEEEIVPMVHDYIKNLKSEHEDNEKIIAKLDKYLNKFDVKKFMKNNPNITSADFHMIMYNETMDLIN